MSGRAKWVDHRAYPVCTNRVVSCLAQRACAKAPTWPEAGFMPARPASHHVVSCWGRVKLVMLQACPFSPTQMVRYNHKTTRRAIRATPFVMLIEIVCLSFAIDRFVK
jgi:hypothetical protein